MPRVKGGPVHARKRKRILKRASGFAMGPGKLYRVAREFVMRAGQYSHRDRRQKKRHFRSLWVSRLNAAVREHGIQYSRFIPALVLAGVELNRKMLSEMAIADPEGFKAIVELVRPHITGPVKKRGIVAV